MSRPMTLYFNPKSRALTARWMLEEVGAPYEIVSVDFEKGTNRQPEFLSVNPMGKIPTLVLADGTVLTETPAILAFLADAYPEANLAPEPGSSERGIYYRWLFFGNGVFEPALIETMMRKDAEPLPKMAVGWGSYDDAVDTIETAVSASTYLTGERFTAADLYLGAQLWWTSMFGAPRLKESRPIQDYVRRTTERDARRRAEAPVA